MTIENKNNESVDGLKSIKFDFTKIRINKDYEGLLPPMNKEAFNSLIRSIIESGQQEPITIKEKGEVLDGHNRLKACKKLKLQPLFKIKKFDNPLKEKLFIVDVNLQRRQLTAAQRIQLSLKKKPILEEMAKLNQSQAGKGVQICTPLGRINEIIARDSGVSARQVSKMETILEKAPEDVKSRVLAGRDRIDKAFNQIKKEEKRTKLIEEAKSNLEMESFESFGNDIVVKNGFACKLFQGDFREESNKIPYCSVDLVFTDPLYHSKDLLLYKDLAVIAYRVLKDGGSLVANANHCLIPEITKFMEDAGLNRQWTLAIKLSGPFSHFHPKKVSIKWKPLLWFVKGNKVNSIDYISDLIESKSVEKISNVYEQSPVEAEHVISRLTVQGQTVLDPFMGSGTTGIATINLHRKFIGIEIDSNMFVVAKSRIAKATL